jgi:hypothetical protein
MIAAEDAVPIRLTPPASRVSPPLCRYDIPKVADILLHKTETSVTITGMTTLIGLDAKPAPASCVKGGLASPYNQSGS